MKKIISLIIIILLLNNVKAQQLFPTYKIIKGDTIEAVQLNEATIIAKRNFENDTARYKYNQMKYYIKTVLPYALQGIKIFNEIDSNTKNMANGEKRRYIKTREREVRASLEDKLKNLNVTQGRLLVKIMNRQLKTTCFEVIKYLHNPIKATAYKTWSSLNGIGLDETYDPEKNRDFEMIMKKLGY